MCVCVCVCVCVCMLYVNILTLSLQGVAMVCGFLVVIALVVAAFFAQKTRSKIWRYGKPNIYWDEPLTGGLAPEGRDVEDWVRRGYQGGCGSVVGTKPQVSAAQSN